MTEQNFRKIIGYRDLWMLKAALDQKGVLAQQEVAYMNRAATQRSGINRVEQSSLAAGFHPPCPVYCTAATVGVAELVAFSGSQVLLSSRPRCEIGWLVFNGGCCGECPNRGPISQGLIEASHGESGTWRSIRSLTCISARRVGARRVG